MEIATAGSLVFQECRTVTADPARLKAALAQHAPGLEGRIPTPPGIHSSLRRAASRRGTPPGYRWAEVGVDPAGILVFALVREDKDPSLRDYKGSAEGWVMVDTTGAVGTDTGPSMATATAVRDLEARYHRERGVLGAPEVWALTGGICRDHDAVKIRDGVLFVPRSQVADAQIAGLGAALSAGAQGVTLCVIPVHADGAAALRGPAERSLLDEVAEIRATLEARKARAAESGRTIRADGIRTMLAETSEIVKRAKALRFGLGIHVEDLTAVVEQMERECMDALAAD
jgi:hypothetical protein